MLLPLLSVRAQEVLEFGLHHTCLSIIFPLLVALTCRAVYNRYFHPLHKFPGPFWGSLTDLYHTYLFSTRQAHVKLLHIHKKHGWLGHFPQGVISWLILRHS